jgi:hypothetical protein
MVSFSSFFRSNARRSALRVLSTVLLVAASIGLLAGCSDPADPIAVAGTWTITGSDWDGDGNDNVERWQISESTIVYDSSLDGTTFTTTYRADIVTYVNGSLNAGDTALTTGRTTTANPGFAVLRFTEVNNAGTGEVGKYNVFRWADNGSDNTRKDFSQGYRDATPDDSADFTNAVFDSASAAEAGATTAAGYFAFASTGAERQ